MVNTLFSIETYVIYDAILLFYVTNCNKKEKKSKHLNYELDSVRGNNLPSVSYQSIITVNCYQFNSKIDVVSQ